MNRTADGITLELMRQAMNDLTNNRNHNDIRMLCRGRELNKALDTDEYEDDAVYGSRGGIADFKKMGDIL
jgi:hypothetical protein